MNQKHVLNEKKTALVQKLVANWISKTKNKDATVNDLVLFLQTDKVQRVLPYNEEVSDEIINSIYAATVSDTFGKEERAKQGPESTPDDTIAAPTNNNNRVYAKRIKAVVDKLDKKSKEELIRMLS